MRPINPSVTWPLYVHWNYNNPWNKFTLDINFQGTLAYLIITKLVYLFSFEIVSKFDYGNLFCVNWQGSDPGFSVEECANYAARHWKNLGKISWDPLDQILKKRFARDNSQKNYKPFFVLLSSSIASLKLNKSTYFWLLTFSKKCTKAWR